MWCTCLLTTEGTSFAAAHHQGARKSTTADWPRGIDGSLRRSSYSDIDGKRLINKDNRSSFARIRFITLSTFLVSIAILHGTFIAILFSVNHRQATRNRCTNSMTIRIKRSKQNYFKTRSEFACALCFELMRCEQMCFSNKKIGYIFHALKMTSWT